MRGTGDAKQLPAIVGWLAHALPAVAGTLVLVVSLTGLVLSDRVVGPIQSIPTWLFLVGLGGLTAMAVAIWVIRSDRLPTAVGLSVATVGLGVPMWAAWWWMPNGIVSILLAAAPLTVAGTAQVGLGWPRLGGHSAATLVTYALAGLGAVVIAVAYDPLADPGCVVTCARAEPVAASIITARGAVTTTAWLLVAGGAIAGWSLLADRRVPLMLRASVVGSLAILLAGWVVRAWRWSDPASPIAVAALPTITALLLGGSVLVSWWAARRDRLVVERLIADVNATWAAGGVPGGVGTVQFAMPEEDRWIDSEGRPVAAGSDDGAVVLFQGGEAAARLLPDGGTSAKAIDELSPGAMMGLSNARLAAVTRARLVDVRESRRRIAAASDAERRRIERDLHDGAQQRLISASLHVSLAASQLTRPAAERGHLAIGQALERLRNLAHGISPAAPDVEGLRPALEDLVRSPGIPGSLIVEEFPVTDDVARAIHAAVASMLNHGDNPQASAPRIEVVRLRPGWLSLRIELDGPAALDRWDGASVADHIAAAGGTMTFEAEATRLVVRAELPCAS